MNIKIGFQLLAILILISASSNSIQMEPSEEFTGNQINNNKMNECLNIQTNKDIGYCLGKEVLSKLNSYDEAESFSLANGIDFVRDEKTPRDLGNFLDKDPMDLRGIFEDAGNIISKRSLRWDMSSVYPGLTMKIGPTLANGVLEFVVDPRLKDRTNGGYNGEMSTGRLLMRNLLVPFLLGFKFQLSTLLPLLLGLVLLASKKAFLLAKVALVAATLFGGGSSFGTNTGFSTPTLSSYTHEHSPYHGHYGNDIVEMLPGYHHHHHRPSNDFFREKSDQSTAQPITPHELRDNLERLFVTKNLEEPREDKVRNARHYTWTPVVNRG